VAALGAMALGVTSLGPAPAAVAADGADGWVVDRVRFEPVDPGGGVLAVEGMGAYRGAIEVVPADGGLAVINDVGAEDYVKGIAEVPASWPTEALRAQAIAARTYALNQKTSTADSPWKAHGADICNTDSCQVYAGLAKEQGSDGANWVAAVDDTAGQVLVYRGRPLFAQYSASNGGRSTAGSQPYLRSIDDPDDARSFVGHWQWGLALGALAPLVDVAPPFVLTGVARQGGAVVFSVAGPDQFTGQGEIGAEELRSRVNAAVPPPDGLPMALPAPDYVVEGSGESAVFSGGGWGHGVGMSQYGALGKAQRGMDAGDILAAYYGGIRPDTLDADQLPSIRVELAAGQGSVNVSPERYFRVVAGSGPQAEGFPSGGIEVGQWRLQPADGGVRVIPPAGRAEPLALRSAIVEPPGPDGQAPTVRYDLSAPAVVTVRYVTPTGLPGAVAPRLVDVGEVVEALPPPGSGGEYQVVIEADGGQGRFVSVPLRFQVAGDVRIRIGALGDERPTARPDRGPWLALAVILFLGSALALRRTGRTY